ncbi:MAG: hypothetical protein AAF184_09535 [Pseudomonadota bacterium]
MSADFEAVYGELRDIMLGVVDDGLVVTDDEAGSLTVRSQRRDKKGQLGWFGAVTIKRSYVAYHLMTLYEHPALADDLSAELGKRRQGKTCFNFKRQDSALFSELAQLTAAARRVEARE